MTSKFKVSAGRIHTVGTKPAPAPAAEETPAALAEKLPEAMNCASCHDVHKTHKPHMSERVTQACNQCHAAEQAQFAGSVHEDLLARLEAVGQFRMTGSAHGFRHAVLDALGGEDWKKGYSLLRPGGLLIPFGWANMAKHGKRKVTHVLGQLRRMPWWTPMKLMHENKGVAGVNMGHLWDEHEMTRDALTKLLQLYRDGAIKPRIDRSFPFEQASDAHAYIEAGQNVGKVLLTP